MVSVMNQKGDTTTFIEADDFKLNASTLQILNDDKCVAMFAPNTWTFVQRSGGEHAKAQ